jgi:signal transduction histidine kinase
MDHEFAPQDATPEDLRRALHACEARFRNTIEKNADGILITSRDGTIRFVNPAAEALLGRDAPRLLGQVFGIPVLPGETAEIDLVRGGAPAGVAEMRVVEIDWEGEPAYLASLRDVTERKQAADAARFLAEAGQLLAGSLDLEATLERVARLCVDHLADVCLIDLIEPDGSVRRAAAAHRDPTRGDDARALRGRFSLGGGSTSTLARVLRAGKPETHDDLSDAALAGLAATAAATATLRDFGCRSALLLPLQARGRTFGAVTLLRGPAGAADAALAQDLVRRAALAIDNARLYDEAQEAVRRRDEFLAMLAHELRNPLAPVRNAMELIRLKGPDDPDLLWARSVVDRQVAHMARLVDDLLDVSRITRGKIRLRRERVELARVVAHAVETSRPLVESRGQRLEVAVRDDGAAVEGDFTRLAQVVSNLLNNAAKYTEEGGRIRLAVETAGEAVIRVTDTGVGIPAEMLPHIFDLFTQVDSTLERSQGGLGIGLTLVRSLVEMHGGCVQAFSEGRGKGSEFVVRLPLAGTDGQAAHESAPGPESRALVPRPSRRVLVVDDNPDLVESLAMLLRAYGHEPVTAHSGLQAIEAARARSPDLVICDIGMPGMSGYKVAQHLRALPGFGRVPLVALTGFGTPDDRRRAREAGFDEHLVKPIAPETLEHVLSSFPGPR